MRIFFAVLLCMLAICGSLLPGFVILGLYQNAVLDSSPDCWLDVNQVAVSTLKFIGSSLLCTLAIMLYSDLAFPAVMCCFGWIFSRISLPQHLQQQHSAAKGHDFCYRPSQPQRQQKTRRNCASVSDHPPLINDIASFAHHLQQLKRGPRILRCRSECAVH